MSQEALDRLCALCGIEIQYTDIWGRQHTVSDQTKQALLAAMGIAADTEPLLIAALEEEQGRAWKRILPPAMVVRESGDQPVIPISLPEARGKKRFHWVLLVENGERLEGELCPVDLKILEKFELSQINLVRYAFPLPRTPDIGYHAFHLESWTPGESDAVMQLIVTPGNCYRPLALADDERVWGFSAQLYALRSERNWGMGGFGDLKTAIELCAAQGADILGLNPLHALVDASIQASPYSPSSRLFLNTLYLDVESIADFAECEAAQEQVRLPQFQAQLRAMRADALVDYKKIAAVKLPVLEMLYGHFREQHLKSGSARGNSFRDFQFKEGQALRMQALFEALQEHFHREDSLADWISWPEPYRNPGSPEVAAFLAENLERIEFYEYLQWQADAQLGSAGVRAMELRLGIGLCQDFPVGMAAGGSEVWSNQSLYALGASIGTPPDDFSPTGQQWGLPPIIPMQLRESAYAPFIATLRKNMRHAGALRIDHVMGLMRQFWVPQGSTPADGAYVGYPMEDLLGIMALESQRNQCLIIGEDLGTVPDAVRAAMESLEIFSYRLLYFEKDADGSFKLPEDYPTQAVAAISTHDLPTLAGYWQGIDLDTRTALGMFPSEEMRQQQIVARSGDQASLLIALERAGLLPTGMGVHPVSVAQMTAELARAIHLYLARSSAKILMVQIEDAFGQLEQVNLPGTTDQYPNWRRKLALNLEQWSSDPQLLALTEALRKERGDVAARDESVPPVNGEVPARIPVSAYRLQFNHDFTYRHAASLVLYLSELGISHCYASPYLKARRGSMHGYDIIDHNALNPEIGSPEDYDRFVEALHRHNMGQILDIVPNHMGVMGSDNMWWLDVLENGQASAYAGYFDIDWQKACGEIGGKLLVPVLGNHYGAVLDNGELKLLFDAAGGEFSVMYFHHRFPVDPREYPRILGHRAETLKARLGDQSLLLAAFQTLITVFGHLPARDNFLPAQITERNRDKEVHKQQLATLCAESADLAWFIAENVELFNGSAAEADQFGMLHELLEAQAYRLAYWRVASDEINYRRFFDINELAGLRTENQETFEATHSLVLQLLRQGKVDGLRIDHPDGLYDPLQYFQRLRVQSSCYLVVEKILTGAERLARDWPVHGTTGYDFANLVNGLFVRTHEAGALKHIYDTFLGAKPDFDELLYHSKRLIMKTAMASELNVLAHQLGRIAQADRHTRDYSTNSLRAALAEVIACFPVYRTYISAEGATDEDRRAVEAAIRFARERSLDADISIFDFVSEALLTTLGKGKDAAYQQEVVAFAMKFQQYTAPVMAKGMEDTSFYLYHQLVSLNEVGGDPRRFGVSVEEFHSANMERARNWPHTMLETSTHDSKRSEDIRARINVLTELPGEWRSHLVTWSRINRARKLRVDDVPCPSRNDEYLLYQTMLGAWPPESASEDTRAAFQQRITQYMLKAVREAKQHSSWINQNIAYEEAMAQFINALLQRSARNRFLADFLPFQQRVARFGMFNSLSQTLLKLTTPGVPDTYQGNELWTFSLVDPDNRRAVDFEQRRRMLDELKKNDSTDELVDEVLHTMEDGRVKLYLTWKTLSLRLRHEALFRDGSYLPLRTGGNRADCLCAFARRKRRQVALVVAPRWFVTLSPAGVLPLGKVWEGTWLETPLHRRGTVWVNALTGEKTISRDGNGTTVLDAPEVFRRFSWALLMPEGQ